MANAEHIKALLKSHFEKDEERFQSIAMQLAAQAAKQGHGRLAIEIRELLNTATNKPNPQPSARPPIPVVQPRGELVGLLSVDYPHARLSDMVLAPELHKRLTRVLHEQRQQHKLKEHAFLPRYKLLLVGPPGSGKTMTAAALAGELHLPLFTILLDGVITKFLGETAAKLRLIFDTIRQTRGVYLFDEFDAIGSQRTAGNDVGEIRRVLNSFLQFLEQDNGNSLLIAATNHSELLDKALFRRFDDVLEYTRPDAALLEKTLLLRLANFDISEVDWPEVLEVASGLSYAELTKACTNASKEAILRDGVSISTECLLTALQERKTLQP